MEEGKKLFNIRIENYTGEKPIEIVHREDEAEKHLAPTPFRAPTAFNIKGTIECVAEWLGKRKGYIVISNSRLVVNRDEATIRLIINEMDCFSAFDEEDQLCVTEGDMYSLLPKSTITGSIQFTEMYSKLHINEDKFWIPTSLSKFLRLNRSIFANKEEGMALVSTLKNVKAKISSDYEKKKELHGQISKTEYFSQEVLHNLPESFVIELAIFKGAPKERYDVEIDADIVDGEIQVQLLSPAVNDEVESARDTLIDRELDKIKKMCPDLVIVEE